MVIELADLERVGRRVVDTTAAGPCHIVVLEDMVEGAADESLADNGYEAAAGELAAVMVDHDMGRGVEAAKGAVEGTVNSIAGDTVAVDTVAKGG